MHHSNRVLPGATSTCRSTGRVVVVLATGLLASSPVFAYIDPGTGSIILQGLLASIAVALGVVRAYWARLKAFFSSPAIRAREADDIRGAAQRDTDRDSDT